jgi:hypothetical protein
MQSSSVGLPYRRSYYGITICTVAGIDVHKKTAVVVVLQGVQPDEDYARGIFGTTQFGLKQLVAFLREQGVVHAAIKSIAQYWRPACPLRPPTATFRWNSGTNFLLLGEGPLDEHVYVRGGGRKMFVQSTLGLRTRAELTMKPATPLSHGPTLARRGRLMRSPRRSTDASRDLYSSRL